MPPERASVSASTPGAIFEDLLIMGSSVPKRCPGRPDTSARSMSTPASCAGSSTPSRNPANSAYDTLAAGRPRA